MHIFPLNFHFFILVAQHNTEVVAVPENGNTIAEAKTIPTENDSLSETQDKDVVSEGLGVVNVYDQWISPPISGTPPKARYEVLEFKFVPLFLACIIVFVLCVVQTYFSRC